MSYSELNLNIISYICSKRGPSSVTELMKLCYLSDLLHVKKTGEQLSTFEYIRYNYGPFDQVMYYCIDDLVERNVIQSKSSYTPIGNEYIVYEINPDYEPMDNLSIPQVGIQTLNEVLQAMNGHAAKALTDVAYKTAPMLAINAKLGGKEHFNQPLDLKA